LDFPLPTQDRVVDDDIARTYRKFTNVIDGIHRKLLPVNGWNGDAAERNIAIPDTNWIGGSLA
jgi:hypothetical protein